MLSHLSHVRLCDRMDCSPLVSFVHGTLQARILEWVAMPSSRGSSWPRDQTWISWVSCIAGRFFTAESLEHVLLYIIYLCILMYLYMLLYKLYLNVSIRICIHRHTYKHTYFKYTCISCLFFWAPLSWGLGHFHIPVSLCGGAVELCHMDLVLPSLLPKVATIKLSLKSRTYFPPFADDHKLSTYSGNQKSNTES